MITRIDFKQAFGYDTEEASAEATIKDNGESMTIQSHSEDADINTMVRRFGIVEAMPHTVRVPSFGDFADVTDYRSAIAAAGEALDHFMKLPAPIRAQFDNDPQNLLDFASIPENIPKLIEMGLGKEIVYGTRQQDGATGPNPPTGVDPGKAGPVS